jgi:arylsulfatase
VPNDFFSTDFYTDKLLAYLAASAHDGRPFFAFAAYTAPHWPLQAPDAYLDRYHGVYDVGYDVIRERRIARQKALGIIPQDFEAAAPLPSTPQNPRWDDLTTAQQRFEARRMEIYAAMVENLDHNVGRLLDYLEQSGQRDDTFVFFQSDNGAEGGPTGFPDSASSDNSYENLGRRYSNVAYGQRWAEVSSAPFRLWKAYATQGGIAVPALARLPRSRQPRALFAGLTHVSDLAPTFLALAGVPDPGSTYQGRPVFPITGASLLARPTRRDERMQTDGKVLADELFGRRYVRRDQWKLVWVEPPHGLGEWELYDLSCDGAESHDVSLAHPEIVRELRAEWDTYAARVGLVLPNKPGIAGKP